MSLEDQNTQNIYQKNHIKFFFQQIYLQVSIQNNQVQKQKQDKPITKYSLYHQKKLTGQNYNVKKLINFLHHGLCNKQTTLNSSFNRQIYNFRYKLGIKKQKQDKPITKYSLYHQKKLTGQNYNVKKLINFLHHGLCNKQTTLNSSFNRQIYNFRYKLGIKKQKQDKPITKYSLYHQKKLTDQNQHKKLINFLYHELCHKQVIKNNEVNFHTLCIQQNELKQTSNNHDITKKFLTQKPITNIHSKSQSTSTINIVFMWIQKFSFTKPITMKSLQKMSKGEYISILIPPPKKPQSPLQLCMKINARHLN
eukprot:TRINITY_DN8116_c0_g1_i12.p2 TRINITY_DN8116_c0_g1~~TRINITY_DN8116_c0_g1_i12.p2  ORF type:complete len:308 (+),score=-14.07 TRINITY_DN8116_c0_g1_i12:649-1572(+)